MVDRLKKPGAATRDAAAHAFGLIIGKRASLEEVLTEAADARQSTPLDPRDRALARAIVTTALRHRNQILAMLDRCWDRPPPKRAQYLNNVLETAVAQIAFMAVPQTAAVDIAIALIGADPRAARFKGFANAVLRRLSRECETLLAATAAVSPFPKWFSKNLRKDHGHAKTVAIAKTFRTEPYIDLCLKHENATGIEDAMALPGHARRLQARAELELLPGFGEGNWWVQDFAAQQPVRILEALLEGGVRGKPVADLCAAPGGKTMQLAAMGAQVTAVDASSRRVERLRENLRRTRLDADIIVNDVLSFEPASTFDGIILDAPCSATGTIRRHPDIVWNSDPADIEKLVALQCSMITRAANWLKPGGVMVYANCSMLKAEGEDLISGLSLEGLAKCDLRTAIDPERLGIAHLINGRGDYRTLIHQQPICDDNSGAHAIAGMDGFFACAYRRI